MFKRYKFCILIILIGTIITTCGTQNNNIKPSQDIKEKKKITTVTKVEEKVTSQPKVKPIQQNLTNNKKIEKPEEEKIDPEITKLAKNIIRWKLKFDHNIWWECGKKYNQEEINNAAYEWASAIITAHNNTTYKLKRGKHKDKVLYVNLDEAIGIIINESRFDRCAVGPHPRKFAYKNKILKRKKSTLSHSLTELEKVFTHYKFRGRLADLGPGQIVVKTPRSKDPKKRWEKIKPYLSITPGIQILFDELASRGRIYNTRKPSSRWPGSVNHVWYTNKVCRQSRILKKYSTERSK